jgi:hypothetical protein
MQVLLAGPALGAISGVSTQVNLPRTGGNHPTLGSAESDSQG